MSKLSRRLRPPSPAMVVAIVALIAALAGGAYAAKKIGTKQLVKKERSQAFVFQPPKGEAIPVPDLTETTLASLQLPRKGHFEVTANANLGTAGPGSPQVICTLSDDGVEMNVGISHVDPVSIYSDHLSLTGFSDGGLVTLHCHGLGGNGRAGNRLLSATRVAKVGIQ